MNGLSCSQLYKEHGFIVWFYYFFKGRIWIGWIKVKHNNAFDWNFKYELGEEGFLILVSLSDGFSSHEQLHSLVATLLLAFDRFLVCLLDWLMDV